MVLSGIAKVHLPHMCCWSEKKMLPGECALIVDT